jgi:hypothetical protein
MDFIGFPIQEGQLHGQVKFTAQVGIIKTWSVVKFMGVTVKSI